jgi:hypothetical protein
LSSLCTLRSRRHRRLRNTRYRAACYGLIHGGLKNGFTAIYGYTSDAQGIRHPLVDEPNSKVDEADALFMIGACAAFVSYMINKARLAGLLT